MLKFLAGMIVGALVYHQISTVLEEFDNLRLFDEPEIEKEEDYSID